MTSPTVPILQSELRCEQSPTEVCRRVRRGGRAAVFLDGCGGFAESWCVGPLVALAPRLLRAAALEDLDARIAGRRARGGTPETGVAVLVAYEALHAGVRGGAGLPRIAAFEVDASLRFVRPGLARLTSRAGADTPGACERILGDAVPVEPEPPAARDGEVTTSLPRDRYLEGVRRIREHIACGDIYQANLCQIYTASYRGDPFELYAQLAAASPAPHSAFVEAPGFALASISPETFLRARRPGEIETWPIKGTRPRGADREADRRSAAELARSPKDRAELLMIVDLERNDLSRVCRAGSVQVRDLARLRSYATVHHLVAGIRGELREGVGPAEVLRATFPGGSITGAPKLRAMEILRALEPVERHWFTGGLLWFGDDGSLDSSILIRSWVFDGAAARLGAGGGIVTDSDPEQEWHESKLKAAALARALGFDPEEAR